MGRRVAEELIVGEWHLWVHIIQTPTIYWALKACLKRGRAAQGVSYFEGSHKSHFAHTFSLVLCNCSRG
jgi:hypothetical protein